MWMRHLVVLGLVVALGGSALPAAAQGDGSPAPSSLPSGPAPSPDPILAGPDPSAEPGTTTRPTRTGPRWTAVRDADVLRRGVLRHVATLGDEAIALATGRDRQGQALLRVVATDDGIAWTRRGRIELTGSVNDLLADGAVLFAVGWDEGATIWRSPDAGRRWRTPQDAAPFAEDAEIEAIARGPGGLLAVGRAIDPASSGPAAAAWRSSDGLAWVSVPEVAGLPPLHAIAGDATTWVVVGSGGGTQAVRWSDDGVAWTDADLDVGPGERIDGVTAVPGSGFLAWGSPIGSVGAIAWSSGDGRSWMRLPDDPALAGVDLAVVRALEGGALTMAVGGAPTGAWAFPWLGDGWRRDAVRARTALCISDVTSVGAILVAVGGTCGAPRPRGRAWATPLEP